MAAEVAGLRSRGVEIEEWLRTEDGIAEGAADPADGLLLLRLPLEDAARARQSCVEAAQAENGELRRLSGAVHGRGGGDGLPRPGEGDGTTKLRLGYIPPGQQPADKVFKLRVIVRS